MINSDYIKQIEEWVNSGQLRGCEKFGIFKNSDECFNEYGLCGIVQADNCYIWCHQDYPFPGDRPHPYFDVRSFDSLEELFNFVKTMKK